MKHTIQFETLDGKRREVNFYKGKPKVFGWREDGGWGISGWVRDLWLAASIRQDGIDGP